MVAKYSDLGGISSEEMAQIRQWAETWRRAGPELERIRREELRVLDGRRALEMLAGRFDYTIEPRLPRPSSGLVEQQRWFMKIATRDQGI